MNQQKTNQQACQRVEDLLGAYVFDDLGAGERTRLERHLAACESCRTAVEEMRGAVRAVEAELAGEPAPVLSASRREMLSMLPPVRRRAVKWFWFSGSPSTLLVQAAAVLAVLAMLGSLLLPATNRARQRAQNVSRVAWTSLEEQVGEPVMNATEVDGSELVGNRRKSSLPKEMEFDDAFDVADLVVANREEVGKLALGLDLPAVESPARSAARGIARPGQPVPEPSPSSVPSPVVASPPPMPPMPPKPLAPASRVVPNEVYYRDKAPDKERAQAAGEEEDLAGWLDRAVESMPADAPKASPAPRRPAAKPLGQVVDRGPAERERRQAKVEGESVALAARAEVSSVKDKRLADEVAGLDVVTVDGRRTTSAPATLSMSVVESRLREVPAELQDRQVAETRGIALPQGEHKLDASVSVDDNGLVVATGGVVNLLKPGEDRKVAGKEEAKQAEQGELAGSAGGMATTAAFPLSVGVHGGVGGGAEGGEKGYRVAEAASALLPGQPSADEEMTRRGSGERRDERLLDEFKRQLRGEEVAESATLERAANRPLAAATGRLGEEKPASGPALPSPEEAEPELVADADGDFGEIDFEPLQAPVFAAVPPNPFVLTASERLSTFALDTDTASYAIARNYLRHGSWPPAGAIRVEEFVNSFDYNYPRLGAGVFAVHASSAASPFRPGLTLLKIGVQGKTVGREGRKPAHFVFVVDSSGSMARRDRLPLVQYALGLLVDQLAASDRITLITYGSEPRLVLDHVAAGERQAIVEGIQGIQCGGSTNLYSAVKLAYEVAAQRFQAGAINRIILCSDGATNVGPVDAEELLMQVERFRQQGVGFTSIGFGLGNYNDAVLEALAKRGDGNYLFVASQGEAREALVERLGATVQHIAKDAKIQVEFNPQRVRRYRLLGYEKRILASEDFRNDAVDAGEVGSGQSATALYEVELLPLPATDERLDLGSVYIRYRDLESGQVEEIAQRLDDGVLQVRTAQDSPHFFLAAGAAEFAELLRSEGAAERADGSLADLRHLLEQVVVALPLNDQARQLLALVRRAEGLR